MLHLRHNSVNRFFRGALRLAIILLTAVTHPSLFCSAAKTIMQRNSRRVLSELQAMQLQAAEHKTRPSLEIDSILEALAQDTCLLILDNAPNKATIGLADRDFLKTMVWLQSSLQIIGKSPSGEVLDMAVASNRQQALREPSITFAAVNQNGFAIELTLECYLYREHDMWISNNPNNRVARTLYTDVFSAPGQVSVASILRAPTLEAKAAADPVDVVFTWVNHSDPEWSRLFNQHGAAKAPRGSSDRYSDDATRLARFHSIDELRFSMRCIAENLPWARRIILFTNCSPPTWLRADHPLIECIGHEQVIPNRFLPTFSSHVIESYLHHIPELSNKFIYLNDDFYVTQPMDKSLFFHPNGCSRAFLEEYGVVSGPVRHQDPDYLNAARNSAGLIREEFGTAATRLHKHVPFALRKDVLFEIENRWPEAFELFRKNRFRSHNDLNLPSFLYHHYALNTSRAIEADIDSRLVNQTDIRWRNQISDAFKNGRQVVCINEGGLDHPPRGWHDYVQATLNKNIPHSAVWETSRHLDS